MHIDDFNFELPEELIAQTPLLDRTSSKLMVIDTLKNSISHQHFSDIIQELEAEDTLILNNTKVMPARLHGVKQDTGGHIEILLLTNIEKNIWECLVKPAKRVKLNTVVIFGEGQLKARCTKILEDGGRLFELMYEGILQERLDELGEMPLPPYIKEKLADQDRYQTVYAKALGSAAAPTAGLHFTTELLEQLKNKGINIGYVTLHVGLGTFRPVSVDDVNTHKMHSEYYEVDEETAQLINTTKQKGRRIIAVGTTSTRTLETVASKYGKMQAASGWTDIFIYPGYQFKVVDWQITNFHLPKSTLLMLVSALTNREQMLTAYKIAVEKQYRFFSFGDAMLIKR